MRGAFSVPPPHAAMMDNVSGQAANRLATLRMPEVVNLDRVRVRVLDDITRTIPHGQVRRRSLRAARVERLLGVGLQEVDEAVVVEGFERRHGSASLRSDAGDVAAKEQPDSGGGVELADAPCATGVVRDAADNNAAKRVVANAAAVVDSRGRANSISRWSGWQHDLP